VHSVFVFKGPSWNGYALPQSCTADELPRGRASDPRSCLEDIACLRRNVIRSLPAHWAASQFLRIERTEV
jgi:hypothetical protein